MMPREKRGIVERKGRRNHGKGKKKNERKGMMPREKRGLLGWKMKRNLRKEIGLRQGKGIRLIRREIKSNNV